MGSSSAPGTDLSALVVGAGSIGRRHLVNLAGAGVQRLGAVDVDASRGRTALDAAGRGDFFTSVEAALKARKWDVAVIATPSSLHVKPATALARAGVHLLIEKPLSDRLEGLDALRRAVRSSRVVAMMAMCYRYHPVLRRLKQLLSEDAIGRVITARCEGGFYLPWWHPKQDYRTEYAGQAKMGGGVLLTSIHTLDYLRWLFGDVKDVTAEVTRVGPLEIDVEDVVAGVCRMRSGALVGVWIDFLQRYNEHRIQVTGENGDLTCVVREDRILRYGPGVDQVATEDLPPGGLIQMYVSEVHDFLTAVKRGGPSPVPLEDGIRSLELARAFRSSGKSGRRVSVRRVTAARRAR